MDIAKGKNYTDEKPVLVLKDVYLLYLQHTNGGAPKYGTAGSNPAEREYPVQILVNAKIAKAIKKLHKKLSYKQFDKEEFEENFKMKAPFEADNYVVIRASANAGYIDKSTNEVKSLNAPKVLSKTRQDLSEVLVGNGSKATVGLNISEYNHPKFGQGTSLNLGMIVVSELVEYIGADSAVDSDDDFDFEADDFDDMNDEAEEEEQAEEAEEEAADDLL